MSVRPLVTTVNSGEMDDLIKTLLEVVGRVGPRDDILDGI